MSSREFASEFWCARADLEVAKIVKVLVELAQKTGQDWTSDNVQERLLPLAVQITFSVNEYYNHGL